MQPFDFDNASWLTGKNVKAQEVITLLESTEWKLVKEMGSRKVFKTDIFFVKVYTYSGFLGFFKKKYKNNFLKEWRILSALYPQIDDVAEPVLLGQSGNMMLLVTRSLEPCFTLQRFTHEDWPTIPWKKRYQLVDLFSAFILRLLQAGAFQEDYNLANFLYSQDNSRFYAIDMQQVKQIGHQPTVKDVAWNLAFLLPCFMHIEKRYRLRFFLNLTRAYPSLKSYVLEIESWAYAKMRKQWLKKTKRKLEAHRKDYFVSSENVDGYFSHGLDSHLQKILLDDPDYLFNYAIKDFKRANRSRVSLIQWQGNQFVLKRYNLKSAFFFARRMIFPSLAWQIWKRVKLLGIRKISTPDILAAVDKGKGFSYRGTYCLYKYLEPVRDTKTLEQQFLVESSRREIILKLASLLSRIHQSGIYHGDAKISNFIWMEYSGKIDINVIDLDSVRYVRKIRQRQRLSDLANMIMSLAWWDNYPNLVKDFFTKYLQNNHLWCRDAICFQQKLQKKVEKKLVHRFKRQQ